MVKRVFSILGIIAGLALIILGLYVWYEFSTRFSYSLVTAELTSFGGDYYTYEYKATRLVGMHLADIWFGIQNFLKICGFVIAGFGLAFTCLFGCKLGETFNKSNNNHTSESRSVFIESKSVSDENKPNPNKSWTCSKCGEINNENNIYCKNCGEYK